MRKGTVLLVLSFASLALGQAPPLPQVLSGSVKGRLLANRTYTIADSIAIQAGDTLVVEPGVTINVNDPSGWIHVLGSFICEGTATNRVRITGPKGTESAGPGQWGGFWGDSCAAFIIKYTDISNAGGPVMDGSGNYRTIDLYSNAANTMQVVFTDNTVSSTVDDAITVHGGNVSILRNVLKWCGAPDGDNISLKDGAWGEVAYNLVWGAGGSSIKVGSSNKTGRVTNICIHNNTCVAGGWRRLDEPGPSVRVEKNGRAQIYNNVFGDCYYGIDIQAKADTLNTMYDGNLFFGSADSLRVMARYYPTDPAYSAVGHAQPHDVLGVKASDLFVSYQPRFLATFTELDGQNNYALKSGTVAAARAFTPPAGWSNPAFGSGVPLPAAQYMGAFAPTTDDRPTAITEEASATPAAFTLSQNYPNPFNPSTTIAYTLKEAGQVRLQIFNLAGQLMMTVDEGYQAAGQTHSVTLRMDQFADGLYLYTLTQGSLVETRKMLLVK